MAGATKTANVTWNGGLMDGKGTIDSDSPIKKSRLELLCRDRDHKYRYYQSESQNHPLNCFFSPCQTFE